MNYLASTFSPLMLSEGEHCEVVQINLNDVPSAMGLKSVVSHEITAKILSKILGEPVGFNRINVSLKSGDCLYAIVPNFRASVAREFTQAEILGAGLRVFLITVF